jgi:DNA-directed RNA polymerase specialized sigma24 family protein
MRGSHEENETQTDLELIAAINGGDHAAFEILYCRYRDWVIGLATRLTGDSDTALDVVQETFLVPIWRPGRSRRGSGRSALW